MSRLTTSLIARAGSALLRTRWLVRAPIWLYRARVGFVFGSRLLMLEHIGRNSGARRYVVLEVVDQPSPGRYVVVSGFGERAQWLRNVSANSHVRVYLASHKPMPATAQRLDSESARRSLARYAAAHPRAWNKLRAVLEQTLGAPIDETGTELPMICLQVSNPADTGSVR